MWPMLCYAGHTRTILCTACMCLSHFPNIKCYKALDRLVQQSILIYAYILQFSLSLRFSSNPLKIGPTQIYLQLKIQHKQAEEKKKNMYLNMHYLELSFKIKPHKLIEQHDNNSNKKFSIQIKELMFTNQVRLKT